MGRRIAVAVVALLAIGGIVTAAVVKTTTKNPTSFATSVSGSSIGVAVGLKGPAGPGVYASTTAGALSVVSGSLNKTTDASVELSYDATPGNYYRLITTVIVGFSFSYAKSFSLWIISGGSMTASNTLNYAVEKNDDGDVQVVLSGSTGSSAITGVNSSQFKPLFKFYGTLVNFSSHASLKTSVSSTSSIVATPLSTGIANGQAATWIIGLP